MYAAFLAATSAKWSTVSRYMGASRSHCCGRSVDVALIAALATERGEIGLGIGPIHPPVLRHQEGERHVDVARHVLRVAADVEMRARLQPGPELARALAHAVLHVDFLGLVAREGGIE